ncbi:MAG TPA: class I adenylate-forming enzyme family protein [Stellaceae bacterium]|nr:class I adenylate-forming enzyme family protein [Stellaceae bacterium]
MTQEYIDFHAAERPDDAAIIDNGRSIPYAEFARDIRKVIRALRALELPRGAKAAIDRGSPYFDWLLRLAFEQLRIVTVTVGIPDTPDALTLVRDFDIVLSHKSLPAGGAPRTHLVPTAWLRDVLANGEEDAEPALETQPDDPIRIVLTSGTTGRPKTLLYTRRVHDASINKTLWFGGFTARSRYLLALHQTVAGPTACIRAGGTVVIEERIPQAEAIATHGITHTTLPPFTLKRILDDLPPDFAKPADLTILSFGAGISKALRERALARLATDVCDMYSANEVGWVSSISGTAEIGTIWPSVRVEVVDAHDRPLPFGEVGEIRVQTDYMLHAYLDYPEAQGRIFKDGWFYPGDVGILHEPGRLEVIGRSNDVLNIGWRKVAPEVIEDMVREAVEVTDVGAVSIPNADGIEEVCVAVVRPSVGDEELLRRVTATFRGTQLGRVHVIRVPAIPRTPNGKLQRKVLKDTVSQAIRQKASAKPDDRPSR